MQEARYQHLESYVNSLQLGTDAAKVEAARCLGRLGMGAEEAKSVLWLTLHDPSSEVRHAAAAALKDMIEDIKVVNDQLQQGWELAEAERAQLQLFAAA